MSSPATESVVEVAGVTVLVTEFVLMNVGVRAVAAAFPAFDSLLVNASEAVPVILTFVAETAAGSPVKFESGAVPVVGIVVMVELRTASETEMVAAPLTVDVAGIATEDFEIEIVFVGVLVVAIVLAADFVLATGTETATATSAATAIEFASVVDATVGAFEVVFEVAVASATAVVIAIGTMMMVAAAVVEVGAVVEFLTACAVVTVSENVVAAEIATVGSVVAVAIATAVAVVVEIGLAAALVSLVANVTDSVLVPGPVIATVLVTLTAALVGIAIALGISAVGVAAFVEVTLVAYAVVSVVAVVAKGMGAATEMHGADCGSVNSLQMQEKFVPGYQISWRNPEILMRKSLYHENVERHCEKTDV